MPTTRRHAHPQKLSELGDIEIQDDDRLGEIDIKAGGGMDVNDSGEGLREVVFFRLEVARTRSLKREALTGGYLRRTAKGGHIGFASPSCRKDPRWRALTASEGWRCGGGT